MTQLLVVPMETSSRRTSTAACCAVLPFVAEEGGEQYVLCPCSHAADSCITFGEQGKHNIYNFSTGSRFPCVSSFCSLRLTTVRAIVGIFSRPVTPLSSSIDVWLLFHVGGHHSASSPPLVQQQQQQIQYGYATVWKDSTALILTPLPLFLWLCNLLKSRSASTITNGYQRGMVVVHQR